ncbi:MAG: hypothetical protein WCS58_05520 [Candidatus Cloacimonadaceae bacterium]|jgi:hypothetical protein
MAHGYMYEKLYIMHEIDRMSIVAFESYVSAPVRIAFQIGESPIQGIVKPCS